MGQLLAIVYDAPPLPAALVCRANAEFTWRAVSSGTGAASSSLRRLFCRMRVAVLRRLGKWGVAAPILAAV